MPLTNPEKVEVAEAFLKCFGEDVYWCGRTLRFMTLYTAGQLDLLSVLQQRALTWQPFIDSGLSVPSWNAAVQRAYEGTITDL